jgi:thiopurine S-methyltransferase
MHPQFWHTRWADNRTGFHEAAANALLVAHFAALALPAGARVFVPLCGKTLDIDWLLAQGHRVAGVELSAVAVEQLFGRMGVEPVVEDMGAMQRHSADGLQVFVGDVFDLTAAMLGPVDAVYDRAALVALPPQMRMRYAQHMRAISGDVPMLLITLEYEQSLVDGPPFSVPAAEVRERYPGRVAESLSDTFQPTGLKGAFPVTESAWKIAPP